MRLRAARLGRSLRRIVLAALAAPLGSAAACRVAGGDAGVEIGDDASVTEAGARAPVDDASVTPIGDGGARVDADPRACAPIPLDAASFEGPADGCADFRLMPCGVPPDATIEDCYVDLRTCAQACGTSLIYYCQLVATKCTLEGGVTADAATIVECVSCAGSSGRRPRGLCAPRLPRRSPLGDYFAAMAHLESASVRAFRDLERWLEGLGAPPRLARAARRAAEDERRHARAATRIARRFGGVTARPRVRHVASPTLPELLEDDAIEGCVAETYGALVATWQGGRATDPRVRRALRRIAVDETRHAALAWEILAWGIAQVGPSDRRRVARALERALGALVVRAERPVDAALQSIAGHPPPETARALVCGLARLVEREAPELS